MSKIGRKVIAVKNVTVAIKGQKIHYKGPKGEGVHVLPKVLVAFFDDVFLKINAQKEVYENASHKVRRDIHRVWGLNRALLANKISGASEEFIKKLKLIGLGYKASVSNKKIIFSLGYSNPVVYEIPNNVSIEVDRSGTIITVKSSDNMLVGFVCSKIKLFRKIEPYKGTGIKLEMEEIRRKAGKARSA